MHSSGLPAPSSSQRRYLRNSPKFPSICLVTAFIISLYTVAYSIFWCPPRIYSYCKLYCIVPNRTSRPAVNTTVFSAHLLSAFFRLWARSSRKGSFGKAFSNSTSNSVLYYSEIIRTAAFPVCDDGRSSTVISCSPPSLLRESNYNTSDHLIHYLWGLESFSAFAHCYTGTILPQRRTTSRFPKSSVEPNLFKQNMLHQFLPCTSYIGQSFYNITSLNLSERCSCNAPVLKFSSNFMLSNSTSLIVRRTKLFNVAGSLSTRNMKEQRWMRSNYTLSVFSHTIHGASFRAFCLILTQGLFKTIQFRDLSRARV